MSSRRPLKTLLLRLYENRLFWAVVFSIKREAGEEAEAEIGRKDDLVLEKKILLKTLFLLCYLFFKFCV